MSNPTLAALVEIQKELKAPKNQYNSFGKYKYRNLEDICAAVKPLASEHGCVFTISDEVIYVDGRHYIVASATIQHIDGDPITVKGWAREANSKKGMDDSQLTGSCSSYARKYAANGLFAIDDTKDADSMDNSKKEKIQPDEPTEADESYDLLIGQVNNFEDHAAARSFIDDRNNIEMFQKMLGKDSPQLHKFSQYCSHYLKSLREAA